MGNHFVLLVDRLLTESTLEAAIESSKRLMQAATSTLDNLALEKPATALEFGDISIPRKLVECRICQDEDLDSNMEAPCSCSGSLKQFKPNYTAPTSLFQIGRIPLDFSYFTRRNWEASRRDLPAARVMAMVADRAFINASYDDQSSSSTRNVISFRLVVVLFMVLLILRHTIPLILIGSKVIIPICFMVMAVTSFQRRRRRQELQNPSSSALSDGS